MSKFNSDYFVPKQPFMVRLSSSYYKYVLGKFGISHFYYFKVDNKITEIDTSVPDGCIDIIIHYRDDGENIGADFYGTDLFPHSMRCYEGCNHFGVRFLPGCVPVLADASMAEMVDKIIPYNEISVNMSLPEVVARTKGFMNQINVFVDEYMKCYELQKHSPEILKQGLINEIIGNYGNIKVEELSDNTCYSVSYIDKIFKNEIGIAPKKFSNIIRFQWLMNRIKVNPNYKALELNQIMEQLGYFDQSHMIHDFKKYTNRTPRQYVTELCEANYHERLKIVD